MATTQARLGQTWGFIVGSAPSASAIGPVNAAGYKSAFAFVPAESKTLSKVKFYLSAITGTLSSTSITAALYSSTTAFAPNTQIEARSTVTTVPTGAGWVEVTGFTTALTAGTQYFVVVWNSDASATANTFTIRGVSGAPVAFTMGTTTSTLGWNKRHDPNTGTYANFVAQWMGMRLEYSDGSFDGMPFSNAAATGTTDSVFSTNELGIKFTSPAGTLRVRGVGIFLNKSGTPTGNPRFNMYNDTSLVATTQDLQTGIPSANATISYFSSTVSLTPNTVYRITLAESTQSDTSINHYGSYTLTIDNDVNSFALMPFSGTAQKTYWNGTSWTDTQTELIPMWLILDTDGEITAAAAPVIFVQRPGVHIRR